MSASKLHTPGPYIVRGEIEPGSPGYAMGADPASDDAGAPRDCGWPYFIREDREFPLGSGPLWLAHGIQRKADADLFAAAPDMLVALRDLYELCTFGASADAFRNGVTDSGGTIDEGDVRASDRLCAARAAIAKAEGRR